MSNRKQPRLRAALGARLRALRKSKKLSQKGLGFASRMSGKFIGEVERGEKSISLDSLARVARALGVPLHELVDVEGPPTDPNLDELVALARRHPRALERLLAIARAFLRSN
ncbi:MAG: hypothetical protein AUH77_03475 [Candidatus Rokubacteria bacterium 13_1_40CM_4_69_39]|nr:MAG: hypothetical protein AUH77_03475 [Candidatus Rokubacteria bacterium 13_1_40CM_4_69_39]